MKLTKRKTKTFHPMPCEACKKEIKIGEMYWHKNNYQSYHLKCKPK